MPRAQPKEIRRRFEALKFDRTTWEPQWQDIRDFILPDAGAFSGEDVREGGKRFRKIMNAEATSCADMLAAGLLGGVSSPSRPWLRLTTNDATLDESPAVKQWLEAVRVRMMMIFAKAEVYNQLHQSYLELPVFGTACTLVRAHPEDLIALQNLTIGEYWLADDEFGRIDTLYRRFEITAKQVIQRWGWEKVSPMVRTAYEADPWTKIGIIHAIEPRLERDEMKRDNLNKQWRSVYFEENGADDAPVLNESGFDDFPALCPRWFTAGGSVYGRGPGAKALSAAKSLQRIEARLAHIADLMSNPPVQYPASASGYLSQFRPGGRIPVAAGESQAIRTAWEANLDMQGLLTLLAASTAQIQKIFYANLFQMIAGTTAQGDRTATEVQALEQEKVLMLGPVLERLHTEMLDPLVTQTFTRMVETGDIPEVPPELAERELSVEYISVLAAQQNSANVNSIVRLTQQIGMLAQLNPNALDKLDVDTTIDELADMYGVPPSMIVAGDQVALIRRQRADQQAQAQQMEQLQQGASAIKDMAAASDSPSMQEVMSNLGTGGAI
ncbi:portal protein [Sutterella sp.]|uniref:portal protein n=1 Tax=Sutterella sp. TaxID=1981025 RepID=UPI0026DF53CC|nr:portal protein [Sutterella sp.]MDO5531058.1 portal protein [Sutterella sp.]